MFLFRHENTARDMELKPNGCAH